MHSLQFIFNELIQINSALDAQITHIRQDAQMQGISPYDIKDANGTLLLAPLLVAKANALNGMAQIRRGGKP